MSITAAALQQDLPPIVAPHGVDLEEVELRRVGRTTRVIVVVDRDGGVDLDTIAAVSRCIGAELEGRPEWATTDYALEVTSPGVDRPLKTQRRWRRNIGRLVEVETTDSSLTGRIVAVDDVRVEIDSGGRLHQLPLECVVRALVQVEFARFDTEQA